NAANGSEGTVPQARIRTPNSSAKRPVASFTRLSPSSTSAMRRGRPISFAVEVAAIASVGETIAPRTNPKRQSNPGRIHGAATATPATVKATSPTASEVMLTRLKENSRQDVVQADAESTGGKTEPGNDSAGGADRRRRQQGSADRAQEGGAAHRGGNVSHGR